MCINKQNKGFTLIELLVVIAIIGLISTFAMVALNTARAKSRDAKRLSDAQAMIKALELYFDQNESYPVPVSAYPNPLGFPGWAWSSDTVRWSANCTGTSSESMHCLLAEYIEMPIDPINTGSFGVEGLHYFYATPPTGSSYQLLIYLETDHPLRCDNQSTPYKFVGSPLCGPSSWGKDNVVSFYNEK